MVLLRPRASVRVARVEPRQIQFVVDDPVERVFEGAEDQPRTQIDGEKAWPASTAL